MAHSVEEQLKLLLEKVDRVLSLMESKSLDPRQRVPVTKAKPKLSPMGSDEIALHQERFEKLYRTWEAGEEVEVESALERMPADELRRFADANNLNVTSKTPKQKVMKLIAGRFRERRQLMKSHFGQRSPMD